MAGSSGYLFCTSARRERASAVGYGIRACAPKNSPRVKSAASMSAARSSGARRACVVSPPSAKAPVRCGLMAAKHNQAAIIASASMLGHVGLRLFITYSGSSQHLDADFHARLVVREVFSRNSQRVLARREARRDAQPPDVRLIAARPEKLHGLRAVHLCDEPHGVAVGRHADQQLVPGPHALRLHAGFQFRRVAVNDEALLFLI